MRSLIVFGSQLNSLAKPVADHSVSGEDLLVVLIADLLVSLMCLIVQ